MMHLAPFMPQSRLSVNTTDPNLALELVKRENIMVNLVGGLLSKDNLSLSGMQSVDYISKVNIDVAFISLSGFSLKNGFTSGDYNESELKNSVVKKAGCVIMLIHSSKIVKSLPYTFCGLENVQILITDEPLEREVLLACSEHNIKVVIAE